LCTFNQYLISFCVNERLSFSRPISRLAALKMPFARLPDIVSPPFSSHIAAMIRPLHDAKRGKRLTKKPPLSRASLQAESAFSTKTSGSPSVFRLSKQNKVRPSRSTSYHERCDTTTVVRNFSVSENIIHSNPKASITAQIIAVSPTASVFFRIFSLILFIFRLRR